MTEILLRFLINLLKKLIMKKLSLLLFCFLNVLALAQKKEDLYTESNIAEYFAEDGTSFKAYDLGTETTSYGMGLILLSSKITGFRYATLEERKKKEAKPKDLKKVIFNVEDSPLIQEKIQIKYVDKEGKLSSDAVESFEFLLYDGKIRLFGADVKECMNGGCGYVYSTFYIQKKDDPFAVLAVKVKSQFSMSSKMGSSLEPIVDAFRVVGGKCTAFSNYLDTFKKDVMQDQKLEENLQKGYKDFYKTELKRLIKEKNIKDLDRNIARKIHGDQEGIFMGIINEYEKNCP